MGGEDGGRARCRLRGEQGGRWWGVGAGQMCVGRAGVGGGEHVAGA